MKSLISEQLTNKLNDLVTTCFALNRLCDRAMSELSVKFTMPKTSNLMHPSLAHVYPKLADIIGDYMDGRDTLTGYGLTPADNTDYASPLDFFQKLLDMQVDFESQIYEAITMSEEDSDLSTKEFLKNFLSTITPITAQIILIVDKAEAYNNDWMRFDTDSEDFITLPIMQGKG